MRGLHQRLAALPVAAVAIFTAVGCGGGGESHTSTGPGDTRATLSVAVKGSTSAVFTALGWTGGVPGADVVVTRDGSTQNVSGTTDAQGAATFTNLLPGTYDISAIRLLTSGERTKLAPSDADVDAVVAAGSGFSLAAPGGAQTLTASAGRRGSLVISELERYDLATPDGNFYTFGGFLELHNNADTSIALSGIVVAKGFPGSLDSPNFPCSLYDSIHNDPDGIWAIDIYRFPDGTPALAPGGTIVLATDAIDHSKIVAGGLDLSHADFEFRGGGADVDNPSVPNMVALGPNSGDTPSGHGLEWYEVDEVVVVARASDVASLPTQFIPNSQTKKIARLPAATILDVLVSRYALSDPYPPCAQAVNFAFDHQELHVIGSPDPRSAHRKVAATFADGRPVLLRTKTSSRDFAADKATSGTIP